MRIYDHATADMKGESHSSHVSRFSEPVLARAPLLLRCLWVLAWPIRVYVRRAPFRRGTGRLVGLLNPLLPNMPAGFVAELPDGGRVALFYREAIGRSALIFGEFEGVETRQLSAYARGGTMAIDVGANVGVLTIPLAAAVGESGLVLALEPNPDNARRLASNIERSGLSNVRIVQAAAGDSESSIELRLAPDPAFHSTMDSHAFKIGQQVSIAQTRIDVVWQQYGRPTVSAIKIDVEGAEIVVLRGCECVLEACKPALLVEAATREEFGLVGEWLSVRGYTPSQPAGFAPWNFLFLPIGSSGHKR